MSGNERPPVPQSTNDHERTDVPCLSAYKIEINGVVQGVGFRPFVFNLAERLGLFGWVLNHSGGVEIEVEGPAVAVEKFIVALRDKAPPLARIEGLTAREVTPRGYDHFEIRRSERQAGRYQLISPDIATCADCLRELFDPQDRRYRYPFINCTNCGPRFTIISDIPYDRPNTTMRVFEMCPDCRREYEDPRDRRFHAQPNACPVCGPRLELVDIAGDRLYGPEVLSRAVELLNTGHILAIKGLGGFHLACDATDARAVRALRARKHRPHKPFAVMMPTLDDVRRHCLVSPEEASLLTSPQCPIVLLPWRENSAVVKEVAPRYRYLGVMLPYTPLHHILLRDVGRPLVMTSGNLSEEPIAADNDEALRRLALLADAFVLHNRDIYARYDDSVWFVPNVPPLGALPQPIRRARGYAPFPIRLPFKCRSLLACGAEIKNTFCLTRDEYAFLSQHIGDMENLETLEHFEQTIKIYQHLFRIEPRVIVHDLHPDYLATRHANALAARDGSMLLGVQHHHAHLAACLADNGREPGRGAVIGAVLDGTGYGTDGHIWGGEWLIGDYAGYRRAAQLEYLPLPGGDAATRHPWRIAFAYLQTLLGESPPGAVPAGVSEIQVKMLQEQVRKRVNCPLTSSMGRLFDAVSALLGVCVETSYEAQAAIELEMVSTGAADAEEGTYPFGIEEVSGRYVVRLRPLFSALLADIAAGVPTAVIGCRFHRTVAQMVTAVCARLAAETGAHTVALSGGCFQNRLLLAMAVPALHDAGLQVLVHHQVPCNDGGLSLGQAAIACMTLKEL